MSSELSWVLNLQLLSRVGLHRVEEIFGLIEQHRKGCMSDRAFKARMEKHKDVITIFDDKQPNPFIDYNKPTVSIDNERTLAMRKGR